MRDGLEFIERNGVPVDGAAGEMGRGISSSPDITDASAVVRCPKLLRDCLLGLLEATPGIVIASNLKGNLLYMNTMGRCILGVGQGESLLTGRIADFYAASAQKVLVEHAIPRCLRAGFWHGETTLLARDGQEIPVSQVLMAHRIERRGIEGGTIFSSIAWDLREYKLAEEELRHQATHDPLTGLPNRALLLDRLSQALHAAQRHGHFVAVLFLDLNDFKEVNDEFGHETGDEVLRTLGKRLARGRRAEDTVARYGGDEFVVLVPDLREAGGFSRVLDEIEKELRVPFTVGDRRLSVAASVGVAVYPDHGEDADTLLQRADSMMYRVKRRHKNPAMHGQAPAESTHGIALHQL